MSALNQALSSRISRPRASGRLASWAPSLGVALAVLGIEGLLAASIADPRFRMLLLAAVGAAALVLVFRFPVAATAGLVVLTASVFHEQFFGEGFGPGGLRPPELLLGGLLLVALVRPKRQTWGGTAGAGLALFLVLGVVCTLIAVSAGEVDLSKAYQWLRPFFLLTIFFVVVRLCEDEAAARRLLAAVAAIAVLSAVFAILLAYGDNLDDTFQDPGFQYVSQQEGIQGFDRVRLPAVALAYGLFFYAVSALLRSRGVALAAWAVGLAALVIHLALSLNRNMWVGVAAGTVLLLALWNPKARGRLVVALAVTLVALGFLLSFGHAGGLSSILEPLEKRGSSVVADKGSSLRDRERETRKAWQTLGENPIVGIGAGTAYGSFTSSQTESGGFVRAPRRFVHNQYLYLGLMAGIPGVLCFLVFLFVVLQKAFSRQHRRPDLVACGVGVTVFALSALVMLAFSSYNMLTAVALLCGCIVVMADGARESSPGYEQAH